MAARRPGVPADPGGPQRDHGRLHHPLREGARSALERFSRGDLPEKMEESFAGDLDRQRQAINRLIDVVIMRNDDLKALVAAASAGRLDVRADACPLPRLQRQDDRRHQRAARRGHQAHRGGGGAARRAGPRARRRRPIAEAFQGRFGDLPGQRQPAHRAGGAPQPGPHRRCSRRRRRAGSSVRADVSRYHGANARLFEAINALLDAMTGRSGGPPSSWTASPGGETPEPLGGALAGRARRAPGQPRPLRRRHPRISWSRSSRPWPPGRPGSSAHRVDPARAQGDYAEVLRGVNAMLDAIGAPVLEAVGVLGRFAEQDLTARMTRSYAGESRAAQGGGQRQRRGARGRPWARCGEAVAQTNASAAQIASSSQAVAAGATQQAASLQQTTSSLEMVTGVTRRTAENASQANALAQSARSAADEGDSAVSADAGGHGEHPGERRGDLADHPGHQRHRLPDQPPGAQRGGGGGPGRRGRAAASRWSPRRSARWRSAPRRRPPRPRRSSASRCARPARGR